MKIIESKLFLILIFSSCLLISDYHEGPFKSPDSTKELTVSVNRTDRSNPDFAYVILKVKEIENGRISELNTGIGDAMKWAIGWFDTKTIVAQSLDIGNRAWQFNEGNFIEIELTEEMNEFASQLYNFKYD